MDIAYAIDHLQSIHSSLFEVNVISLQVEHDMPLQVRVASLSGCGCAQGSHDPVMLVPRAS
jgi:hypothetical protein